MKDNKTIYYHCRKAMEWTRDEACAHLDTISVDRLERIENSKSYPSPAEVKEMARVYKANHLCNYFCTHDCEIGKDYIPEIKIKDLSQIVLETLASLNTIDEKKKRLIEITVDGKISGDELKDFILIKHELDKVSMTIDSLKLWTEQMKSNGSIDEEEYKRVEEEVLG